jgi:putative endonuclease
MKKRQLYYVYILSSPKGVLYVGVTRDLARRIGEHRTGVAEGFTKRYAVSRLVFWEETSDVRAAITREKQLKSWGRERKLALIRSVNPRFRDLAEEVE